MRMMGYLVALACLIANTVAGAQSLPAAKAESWENRPALLRHFVEAGVPGTIVVFDTDDRRWIAADPARAFLRYPPASTFKIPNTLIALETGVAADEKQAYRWDGIKRGNAAWNQDQTLASAYRNSAYWAYQEIARSVGATRMQQSLRDFRYGNARSGPGLDTFWVRGDLRISAVEQIEFLRRLNDGQLPLSARTLSIGRRVMLQEETATYRLFAKTGWADAPKPNVGWYVGWIERGTRKTYFALNIDMPHASEDIGKRIPLTRRLLADLGY